MPGGVGAYDFFKWYPTLWPASTPTLSSSRAFQMKAFKARSALYHAEKDSVAYPFAAWTNDERVPLQQARAFAAKLQANHIL